MNEILNKLKINPKNKTIYVTALTHPSYINEHQKNYGDLERLEFMGDAVLQLFVSDLIFKQYPTLKADTMFNNLQKSISEVEENLQAARSNYNSNVSSFNKAILVFPASIVAGNKFTKKEYFEAEEAKRQDVKIEF